MSSRPSRTTRPRCTATAPAAPASSALDHPAASSRSSTPTPPTRRAELLEWLRARRLPGAWPSCPAAMVTVLHHPLPGDRMTYVKQVEGVDARLTLLWFLETDPRECWEDHFCGLEEAVAEGGLGKVELVAP